jgi:hypothetical protein
MQNAVSYVFSLNIRIISQYIGLISFVVLPLAVLISNSLSPSQDLIHFTSVKTVKEEEFLNSGKIPVQGLRST